jgi:hypothetical protein
MFELMKEHQVTWYIVNVGLRVQVELYQKSPLIGLSQARLKGGFGKTSASHRKNKTPSSDSQNAWNLFPPAAREIYSPKSYPPLLS